MRMLKQEEEEDSSEDVEVTWEDQQRICAFSKLNTRVRGYEERLRVLKVSLGYDRKLNLRLGLRLGLRLNLGFARDEKEVLDDLATELELADEDQPVLYHIGETFIHLPLPRALNHLEHNTATLSEEISTLADKSEQCEKEMNELKVSLYSKFGSAINLDE